jgi:outer membrane receptor protein involved in Fe transport
MKKKFLLLILLWVATAPFIYAQTVIRGKIADGEQMPLPGASVVIKGTTTGTTSGPGGEFTLSTPPPPFSLIVSSVGYQTKEIVIRTSPATDLSIALEEQVILGQEVVVSASRVEQTVLETPVTVEKIGIRQFGQSPAVSPSDALQNVKGVDLLTQSLTFKSVNLRGFGANNNNRFLQLTDGMDNRSPGLGFGFGSAAGVSDLDVESIEILPGASSALYGPDALQGLQLTRTKSPFDYPGLSAYVRLGVNNVGKSFGPKPYTDVAIRYAQKVGNRFAYKVNFSALNGTDFIADDYSDRSTRGRRNFFVNNAETGTTTIGYTPNNNPATNFEYDGVNSYGDDITNGGSFDYTAGNTTNQALVGQRVTRTGYTELDLLGNKGRVHSYRANAALHYKLTDNVEAIGAWYFGTGNFIRTAGFREYFPDYRRHQVKLELRGSDFFVRSYATLQKAEGYNLGILAARLLQIARPTNQWAADFANAYNGDISAARNAADNTRFTPGSAEYNRYRDELINTLNNARIPSAGQGGVPTINGVRLLDNSSMTHTEGMYNFKRFLPANLEVLTGASWRRYFLESRNTVFATGRAGNIINEYGWYLQGGYNLKLAEGLSFKPTAAVRYDKNDYFRGGFTPRVLGLLSLGSKGNHNFRASWQSAFRNPSPNQLLSDGSIGEVGGTRAALQAAALFDNQGYTESSVNAYRSSVTAANPGGNQALLVPFTPRPQDFTTEKINTWEVGYKGMLWNKLFADVFYFNSRYDDFIAAQNIIQPVNGQAADLRNTADSRVYGVNFNNFNEIFVNGWGFGLEYAFYKGFTLAGNYARQVGRITLRDNAGVVRKDPFGSDITRRRMSDPEVAAVGRNFFISPENRYNLTLSNAKVLTNLGFAITYRWTDRMWVEQGNTQGDVWLPAWNTVDAQVSLRMPRIKTVLKVGGTNLLNQYYAQGYGLARIGGLYYIALSFDEFLR